MAQPLPPCSERELSLTPTGTHIPGQPFASRFPITTLPFFSLLPPHIHFSEQTMPFRPVRGEQQGLRVQGLFKHAGPRSPGWDLGQGLRNCYLPTSHSIRGRWGAGRASEEATLESSLELWGTRCKDRTIPQDEEPPSVSGDSWSLMGP